MMKPNRQPPTFQLWDEEPDYENRYPDSDSREDAELDDLVRMTEALAQALGVNGRDY